MNSDEIRYLKLLSLQRKSPNLDFLSEIVKRHLAQVPYENISKIIRFQESGPTIPDFSEFVAGIEERNYGGTCFAQNIHFNRLLNDLGFQSRLVAIRREGEISHVNLRVSIDGSNYFVDIGIMSSIAGPYLIQPEGAFDTWVGNQRYVFTPSHDLENFSLEIHRDGKVIRSFQSTSEHFTESELEAGIRKTYEPSAMFMTTLCVHRAFESHSVGIWNRHVYKVNGTDREVKEVQSFSELNAVFKDELLLPDYPLEQVLELLRRNGTHLF